MRTTLKRGIGRGAGADGNGHVVLPPQVLSPIVVYRQPPPPPRSLPRRVGRLLARLLALLLLLASGAGGGGYLWLQQSVSATAPRSVAVKRAAKRLSYVAPHQPAIALVLGSDHRASDRWTSSNSDTIMLIRTDPETKTVSLLSIPRDLYVQIHCPGRGSWGGKINSAYAACGPLGTLETVRAVTGLPINYLINVNFRGFIEAVDELGGVWMDIDRRYQHTNLHTPATNYANIDLQPGYQRLTGAQLVGLLSL